MCRQRGHCLTRLSPGSSVEERSPAKAKVVGSTPTSETYVGSVRLSGRPTVLSPRNSVLRGAPQEIRSSYPASSIRESGCFTRRRLGVRFPRWVPCATGGTVDTLVLETSAERRGGSTPSWRT